MLNRSCGLPLVLLFPLFTFPPLSFHPGGCLKFLSLFGRLVQSSLSAQGHLCLSAQPQWGLFVARGPVLEPTTASSSVCVFLQPLFKYTQPSLRLLCGRASVSQVGFEMHDRARLHRGDRRRGTLCFSPLLKMCV